MRKCIQSWGLILAVIVAVPCYAQRASASLFATFNLNQGLYESGAPYHGVLQETTPVTDTALPFQQTVSQITATNGVTSTYNAYDTGTSSGFTINSSAYTTALNNSVEEESAGPLLFGENYTTFSFTQPVSYTIAYQLAGASPSGHFDVSYNRYPDLIDNLGLYISQNFSQSGTLSPGVVFTLDESWGLSNINDSLPANLSGSESISLTFTAIPEPGSLSLLVIPLALLSRRRGMKRESKRGRS